MLTYHTRRRRIVGQGMTEYIIVVALIAVAAIGVCSAFGDLVRGQTSVAAVALSGKDSATGRRFVNQSRDRADGEANRATLENFEK